MFDNNEQNHINFNQNQNFDRLKEDPQASPIKPNFSKAELNSAILPDWIAKEIRFEKYRLFFINFFSSLVILFSLFFVLVYYIPSPVTSMQGGETKWNIPTNWIPHPGFMFPLMAIGLLFLTLGIIQYVHLMTSIKAYKGEVLMNHNVLPYFIVKSYRHLVARVVYLNWICISIYVISGIIIGVFFILRAAISWDRFKTELIIMYVILGVTFLIHLTTLISSKVRKGNLTSHNNGDVIPVEETRQISKHANRVCLTIFLIVIAILLIFVFIPYVIIRKRENRPINPLK